MLLTYVVPVCNEFNSIPFLVREIAATHPFELCQDYELIFVDDGSTDSSFDLISKYCLADRRIKCIKLSRNFGHQPAIAAGLSRVSGDYVAILDADMQDPPGLIPSMLKCCIEGFDVAYGVRRTRKEAAWKKFSYWLAYRLISAVSEVPLAPDSGDFCVMTRRVCDILVSMPEQDKYVRGLRGFVGFDQIGVPYDRPSRIAGNSKYTISSLIRLAMNGVFGFSALPLRVSMYYGSFVCFVCVLVACVLTFQKFFNLTLLGQNPNIVPGWYSLVLIAAFMLGSQMVMIGLLGEYLSRVFLETKRRPSVIVDKLLNL